MWSSLPSRALQFPPADGVRMQALASSDILALWERGAHCHALDRSALLCAWARPELPAHTIADLPLGTVTASLLQLREASFGTRIQCHVDCEHCGERLELVLLSPDLLQPMAEGLSEIDVRHLRVRAPCLRDLAAVANEPDVDSAARRLLARCILHSSVDLDTLPDAALREVENALEALDPNADLALDVHCAACGHRGTAQLDAGALLWDEIDAHARALFYEVHVLARTYGWTEAEILGLGPTRRATYLAMANG
jgi:hypothetical protein